ncbi:MAG: flap endonuclease [Clostridiales bacterium]|nr:flap endonuclease [Clostridiales bacterium]
MKKLLIVDGSNLLFQMFFGMPARIIGKNGKPVQGTLGFIGALLKIIRMVEADHVLVAFDGEYITERTQIDADYKQNRPDYSEMAEEDTPFSQLNDIYRALEFMGIRYKETETCEADDWIAGYAKRYGDQADIVIASQDRDFFQLITERVHVLRYRGKNTVICTPESIREKLGIKSEQYALFKSLTGDTADNIHGVKKVGPKTAAALLHQFDTMEELLSNAHRIEKPSVRESILCSTERIRTNYALIRLTGTEELPFEPAELTFQDSGFTTTQTMREIGLM